MNKNKLLIVAERYFPKVDGVLIFIQEFIKRAKNEFEIDLLVPEFSSKKISNIKPTFLDVSKRVQLSGYKAMAFTLKNIKKIKVAVKEADSLFVQEIGPIGFLAIRYAKKYNKQVALYVHNTHWDFLQHYLKLSKFLTRIVKRFFVYVYNKADLIMIPYRDLENELRAAGVKKNIQIARLGIDIDRFTPAKDKLAMKKKLKLSEDKPIIGYVGRISNEKNLLTLLKAHQQLEPNSAQLLIVGDGDEEIIKKLKKAKNCKVTGFVNNVEDYLKAMDIFVMPSLTETTSLATLEAMSSRLAVVSTKVGFMKKYLIKDHNGIFFPRNNSHLLAIKLKKLLRNKELREKLGENARKTVAYSFSWERSINKIKKLLIHQHYEAQSKNI